MKLKMAADQVLKRFARQIRKEDAISLMLSRLRRFDSPIPVFRLKSPLPYSYGFPGLPTGKTLDKMINTPKREKSRRRPPRDNSAGDTGGEYWEIGDRKHLTLGNKPSLSKRHTWPLCLCGESLSFSFRS